MSQWAFKGDSWFQAIWALFTEPSALLRYLLFPNSLLALDEKAPVMQGSNAAKSHLLGRYKYFTFTKRHNSITFKVNDESTGTIYILFFNLGVFCLKQMCAFFDSTLKKQNFTPKGG